MKSGTNAGGGYDGKVGPRSGTGIDTWAADTCGIRVHVYICICCCMCNTSSADGPWCPARTLESVTFVVHVSQIRVRSNAA